MVQNQVGDATKRDETSAAHARTLSAEHPIEVAPTVAAPSSMTVSVRGAASPTLTRTTVLPRVSTESGAASLVYEEAPRYQQLSALGEGGVGEVVRVRDNDICRVVALKRLKPEMQSSAPLARFVEEIRTTGQLEHPNIVPIHDVGVDENGHPYFVMKHVNGETLESVIENLAKGDPSYHRRFTFEHRVQIFTAILEAVAFAHDAGFIHRDLKPANVMVGRFGEVMLMDWGIAKRLDGSQAQPLPSDGSRNDPRPSGSALQTHAGALVGTPAYMSPEQARGETDLDARSDVYSLSLLLFELLTLRHPFADKSTLSELLRAVIGEGIPSASFVPSASPHQPTVPMDLSWFVRKGLEKDREKRYPSVRSMLDRLQRRLDGDIPIQCHITFLKQMTHLWVRFVNGHPKVMTAVLTLLVLGLPVSLVLLLRR